MSDGSLYTGRASIPYFDGVKQDDVVKARYGNGLGPKNHQGIQVEKLKVRQFAIAESGSEVANAIRGAEALYQRKAQALNIATKVQNQILKGNPNEQAYIEAAIKNGFVPCD